MPCTDGRDNNRSYYNESVINELKSENKKLEACLCAILTELETFNIADKIIGHASQNGEIDIMDFWSKHKAQDEVRLLEQLDKFSNHELDIIKKLLK